MKYFDTVKRLLTESWFDEARRMDRNWRLLVTWFLVAFTFYFCLVGPFVSFSILRAPLAGVIREVAFWLFCGRVLWTFLGKKGKDVSGPRQEGGLLYVAVILCMDVWWVTSTVLGGTGTGSVYQVMRFDPTVSTQLWLSVLAVSLIVSRRGTLDLGSGRERWLLSYLAFLTALLMMIADTDFHFPSTITWQRWITWRILNYAIILPYLLAGVLAIHGMALRRIVIVGTLAIVGLFSFLLLTGRNP